MRKLATIIAVVAAVGAVSADAANVTFGIRQAGTGLTSVAVPATGGSVSFEITAVIDDGSGTSDGLALWGSDLTFGGTSGAVANIASGIGEPGANPMLAFTYPNGVTNPPHVAAASGYRGTNNGTSLLQMGGGQNTIGNPASGGAPFPIGTVVEEVGAAGLVVVGTGTYNVPAGSNGDTHLLTLQNCFANTIDNNEVGPTVFNVSAATTTCAATLTISVSGVPAATATAAISRRANAAGPGGFCDTALMPARKSEGHSGGIEQVRITFDVPPGAPSGSGVSLFSATCAAPSFVADGSAVSGSVSGSELVLTFSPALANAKTYRIDIGSSVTSIPGQSIEVRGLVGDVNSDGSVNATDRSVVVGAWTGPGGFSCPTDVNSSGGTNATDRSVVVGAWTGGAATNCAP